MNEAFGKHQARSLRPKHAASLLGISLPTFYRWLAERPNMPRPRRLSARCTVFDQDELLAWRDAQMAGEQIEGAPGSSKKSEGRAETIVVPVAGKASAVQLVGALG